MKKATSLFLYIIFVIVALFSASHSAFAAGQISVKDQGAMAMQMTCDSECLQLMSDEECAKHCFDHESNHHLVPTIIPSQQSPDLIAGNVNPFSIVIPDDFTSALPPPPSNTISTSEIILKTQKRE